MGLRPSVRPSVRPSFSSPAHIFSVSPTDRMDDWRDGDV